MVTDAKDFELLGDPSKMTGYSRPPESKLTTVTRVLGVCTAVVLLMITMIGMQIGIISPYLAQSTTENSSLPLTLDEASWIVSLSGSGRAMGAIFGSASVHFFGSKRMIVINGWLIMLAWILLLLANSGVWLHGLSLVRGISSGILYVSFPIYLGEVVSPSIRGALVAYAMTGSSLGIMMGTVMGTYTSMSHFTYVGLALTIATILIFVCLPETPHFLVRMGQLKNAEKSIMKYNPKMVSKTELESIKDFVSESSLLTFANRLRELKAPHNRKAGFIMVSLYLLLHFSGLNTVLQYMEIILTQGMVTMIRPATVVTIATVLDIVAGCVSMCLADKCGRRAMWMISSGGGALSMIATGVRFSLLDHGYSSDTEQWLPIVSIICFRIFLFGGLYPIPSMYMSELIAPNIKSIVACMIGILSGLFIFVAGKSYQHIVDAIGQAYFFYMNAVILVLALIFGLTLLPETTGKSLPEIQNL